MIFKRLKTAGVFLLALILLVLITVSIFNAIVSCEHLSRISTAVLFAFGSGFFMLDIFTFIGFSACMLLFIFDIVIGDRDFR